MIPKIYKIITQFALLWVFQIHRNHLLDILIDTDNGLTLVYIHTRFFKFNQS